MLADVLVLKLGSDSPSLPWNSGAWSNSSNSCSRIIHVRHHDSGLILPNQLWNFFYEVRTRGYLSVEWFEELLWSFLVSNTEFTADAERKSDWPLDSLALITLIYAFSMIDYSDSLIIEFDRDSASDSIPTIASPLAVDWMIVSWRCPRAGIYPKDYLPCAQRSATE